MNLRFYSLASGSSGNSYLIESRESAILIDAGISTRRIHQSLETLGVSRDQIQAVFVTHEHADHIKGTRVLSKSNPDWFFYASQGTAKKMESQIHDEGQLKTFSSGTSVDVGDMNIRSFRVSHDAADPVGFSVSCRGSVVTILTDTGIVPENAYDFLGESDLIVLEANHEVNMLKAGSYPYFLKQRILGDQGHLSNEAAGEVLREVMEKDKMYRKVLLAHLSEHNNFPELAKQTVVNLLEERQIYVGRHLDLSVLHKEGSGEAVDI